MAEIDVNEKAIVRLKQKILIKENDNLRTKQLGDAQMVNWIKKQIEEEAKCYSNQ